MRPEEGKIMVITGPGKGKTTSALGIAMIYWGEDKRVLILQFIKGASEYGELKASRSMGPKFKVIQMGMGFVGQASGDEFKEHRDAARKALEKAREYIASKEYDLVVLDEILYCIKFGLFTTEDVINNLINIKPENVGLILTGRDAPQKLIDLVEYVYEVKSIKHHFSQGIRAQPGIEF